MKITILNAFFISYSIFLENIYNYSTPPRLILSSKILTLFSTVFVAVVNLLLAGNRAIIVP